MDIFLLYIAVEDIDIDIFCVLFLPFFRESIALFLNQHVILMVRGW